MNLNKKVLISRTSFLPLVNVNYGIQERVKINLNVSPGFVNGGLIFDIIKP